VVARRRSGSERPATETSPPAATTEGAADARQ
jgi:hypothetical protein